MFFNSYLFIFIFLPLALLGYYGLNSKGKYREATWFLLGMSLWFYGYFSLPFLGILLLGMGINYFGSRPLAKGKFAQNQRKWLLGLLILANVALLFVCKYLGFFTENVNLILKSDLPLLKIAMPLGISFYTFQQIAYLVDSYRGETADHEFAEYALFISFFPQLVEGPILLHGEFIPKLRDLERRKVDYERLTKGLYAFSLGLAKKVLIADHLAAAVEYGFVEAAWTWNSGSDAFFAMVMYTLQIYFDFSGYCDMALGLGEMFGLEIPVNFNSPYKAASIADFWDRWHITLTRFFTRYVYIPLGGSRKGTVRTCINVLIVFLISGLWHGAAWTFVLWGLANGIAMVIYRLLRKWIDLIPKVIRIALTFVFDVFAWTLFRAGRLEQALSLMKKCFVGTWGRLNIGYAQTIQEVLEVRMLARLDVLDLHNTYPEIIILLFVLVLLFSVFFMKNTQEKMETFRPSVWKTFVIVVLFVWSVLSFAGVTQFIYVNF